MGILLKGPATAAIRNVVFVARAKGARYRTTDELDDEEKRKHYTCWLFDDNERKRYSLRVSLHLRVYIRSVGSLKSSRAVSNRAVVLTFD